MIPKIRVKRSTATERELEERRPVVAARPAGLRASVVPPCGHARSRRVTNRWVRPETSAMSGFGPWPAWGDLWSPPVTSHPVIPGDSAGAAASASIARCAPDRRPAPPAGGAAPGPVGGALDGRGARARWAGGARRRGPRACRGRASTAPSPRRRGPGRRPPATGASGARPDELLEAGADLRGRPPRARGRPEPGELVGVGARPHPGDGGQVVGGRHREALRRVVLGRSVLEPHDARRQHAAPRPARARSQSSTVPRSSPTTSAPGPCALEGEHLEEVAPGEADVAAVAAPARPSGIQNRRRQPHDVVDPQAAVGRHRGAEAARPAVGSRPPAAATARTAGAPTPARRARSRRVGRRRSRRARAGPASSQASAPEGSAPMARSWTRRGPTAAAAAASWSATRSWSQAWKATRSASGATAAADRRRVRGGGARPATPARPGRAPRPARRSGPSPRAPSPCSASASAANRARSSPGSAAQRCSRAARCAAQHRSRSTRGSARSCRARAAWSATNGSSAAPGTSSTRSRSGLRQRRLEGEYGLAGRGATGVGACSGLSPTAPPPSRAATTRRGLRTSARSPMPQLARERDVGTCMVRPQVRRSGGRWHRPGLDEDAWRGRRRRPAQGVEPERQVRGQHADLSEVGAVLEPRCAGSASTASLARGARRARPSGRAGGSPIAARSRSRVAGATSCQRPAVSSHPSSMPQASVATDPGLWRCRLRALAPALVDELLQRGHVDRRRTCACTPRPWRPRGRRGRGWARRPHRRRRGASSSASCSPAGRAGAAAARRPAPARRPVRVCVRGSSSTPRPAGWAGAGPLVGGSEV